MKKITTNIIIKINNVQNNMLIIKKDTIGYLELNLVLSL